MTIERIVRLRCNFPSPVIPNTTCGRRFEGEGGPLKVRREARERGWKYCTTGGSGIDLCPIHRQFVPVRTAT